MPMSTTERASIAGRARQAALTPEQRQESMRKARQTANVNGVVKSWPALSDRERTRILAAQLAEGAPPLTSTQAGILKSILAGGAGR